MLKIGRKQHIVIVVGRDERSRRALVDVRIWQEALGASLKIILVSDIDGPREDHQEALQFCRSAFHDVSLALKAAEVVACSARDAIVQLEQSAGSHADLVVFPGSCTPSAAIGTIPLGRLWKHAAARKGSLLLSRRQEPLRRVLVLTDGTPRTVPVLAASFELADRFRVQLSHVDSLRVPNLGFAGGFPCSALHREDAEESARKYLRVVHSLVAAIKRGQRDTRPDLLLIGATIEGGGAIASALASTSLPCSVLFVPL